MPDRPGAERKSQCDIRWLLGLGSDNWHRKPYHRIRDYSDEHQLTPWETLEHLSAGIIQIPYTAPLPENFNSLKDDIEELEQLSNDGEEFPEAIGNLAYQF